MMSSWLRWTPSTIFCPAVVNAYSRFRSSSEITFDVAADSGRRLLIEPDEVLDLRSPPCLRRRIPCPAVLRARGRPEKGCPRLSAQAQADDAVAVGGQALDAHGKRRQTWGKLVVAVDTRDSMADVLLAQ